MINLPSGNKASLQTALQKKKNLKTPINQTTHLYLTDKFLTSLQNICVSDTLTVLYLHNNSIRKIENINAAVKLTSLYLQKNKITKIENLEGLKKLRKLYLGHNEISVVEGLECLSDLEELHLEKQRLNGDALCFDPRTIAAIAKTLQVLNISNNNITSIYSLNPLRHIKMINACYNHLTSIQDVCDTLKHWYFLTEASFTGNAITKQHLYRENIIKNTYCLTVLDCKEVSETTRRFIKRFEQEKLSNASKHSINLAEKISNIPKHHPLSIQKAVSQSILKKTKPCFDDSTLQYDVSDIYIPWKTMSTVAKSLPRSLKNPKKTNVNKSMASPPYFNFSYK